MKKSDVETVAKIIKDSLKEFCITGDQVTTLVTDGAARMLKVETIRKKYPMVNNLMASTKKVFVKSPKHIRVFKELCPKHPLPPQPVITRWGTWLQAVFYYHKYFANVKDVILKFKSKESAAFRESQQIDEIPINYSAVVQAISQLENSHLFLRDSLNTLDNLQAALESLADPIEQDVAQKFRAALNKNPDLQKVRSITENKEHIEEIKEYLNYANPTSLDVERSFSKYTKTFSDQRRRLIDNGNVAYVAVLRGLPGQ